MIAETVVGRGDRAFEYYKKIAPAYLEEISDVHRTEPYVYAQMVAGKDAVRFGEAKNSWLTGTAAWNWVAIANHILGIRPELGGLRVAPCIGARSPTSPSPGGVAERSTEFESSTASSTRRPGSRSTARRSTAPWCRGRRTARPSRSSAVPSSERGGTGA